MLKKLFNAPDIKDICPNCGTACSATDVLCPNCGGNLDELFEKLPEEAYNVFGTASKKVPFLTWLTPLLLILSPLLVSLATVLPVVLNMPILVGRSSFLLIWYAVPSSALSASGPLLVSAIPLFLCTTDSIRAKIGNRLVVILATLFSVFSAISLWFGLWTANIMTTYRAFGFFGMQIFIGYPDQWVYIVIGIGFVLIALNFMVIIGQGKTA